MTTPNSITVIGDGGWGTALAIVLVRNGYSVTLWSPFSDYAQETQAARENKKFLPGITLPDGLTVTGDRQQAVHNTSSYVMAIPSKFYRSISEKFADAMPKDAKVVSVSKGFNKEDHKRLSETLENVWHLPHVAALSGPSHAEEVARGIPSAVTIASTDHDLAVHFQTLFNQPAFRVYTSTDIIGVELGGAMKNVMAIASGISDGIGYGDNTKAALITRGLAEMTRLGQAYGADPVTFMGLSGMGDLIVTCASQLSRNRAVGERLGKGESIEQILEGMEMVAEGVWTCEIAFAIAEELQLDLPISREAYNVIYNKKDPAQAVQDLLTRDAKPER